MELDTPGRPAHLFPRIEDDAERAAWLLGLLAEEKGDPLIKVQPNADQSDLDELEDEMSRALDLARVEDPNSRWSYWLQPTIAAVRPTRSSSSSTSE